MTRAEQYDEAVARRRRFALPGYRTLAETGFDGAYVSPIQITSGNLEGPMLITKDWLDAPSAIANRPVLAKTGYLPGIPFNQVIDRALALVGMRREDIYITPVFKLLPPVRSHPITSSEARASFEAVTRFELMGRRPIAAGSDAGRVLDHFGIDHIKTIHPSARGLAYRDRAAIIARSLAQT
ncbi:uracil-DNA glycosylase family protein [Roseivivax sp. CAU 1753]